MAGPKGTWQALLQPVTGQQYDWMAQTLETVGLLAHVTRRARYQASSRGVMESRSVSSPSKGDSMMRL